MLVNHKGETIKVVTIKELYELAVSQGMENAALGMCFEDEETEINYCEEINIQDIEFGGYYIGGNKAENKVCDCIWLNNHDF